MVKICSHCGIEKDVKFFSNHKGNKDGLNSWCKECCSKNDKKYREMNKQKLKEQRKEYYEKNKDKFAERSKEYRENNKELIKSDKKNYYKKNKEKISEKSKEYCENNKEKNNERSKEYYQLNKQKRNEYIKKYRENNKEKLKEKNKDRVKEYYQLNKENRKEYRLNNKENRNNREKERRNGDSLYNLKCVIRSNISQCFKKQKTKKQSKTQDILGCTFNEFKEHIESKFEDWMNWNNHGNWDGIPTELNKSWDLDHIIPISSAQIEEDVYKLNHYTNFQPLCSYINRNIKRNKN